jgi:hypothetical protein
MGVYGVIGDDPKCYISKTRLVYECSQIKLLGWLSPHLCSHDLAWGEDHAMRRSRSSSDPGPSAIVSRQFGAENW